MSYSRSVFGRVVDKKPRVISAHLGLWRQALADLDGQDVVFTVATPDKHHSDEQRSYWFIVVGHVARWEAEQRGFNTPYPKEIIHDLLLRTFGPTIETSLGPARKSAKKLGAEEFCLTTSELFDVTEAVREHYRTLGLDIPPPKEIPEEEYASA